VPVIANPGDEVISGQTYKDAGVDIDAGNRLVEAIKPLARATAGPGVVGGIGGFGAIFDPVAAGFSDPLLVATTDGVGTKLKVAIAAGRPDNVGIDLVAMCVNDLVVQGARPLFFLDYFATGRLDVDIARRVVAGIANGCREAGCALIGGETAEMPGMYQDGDYDLAGFAVGAVERDKVLTGGNIVDGDLVIGLPSNGIHSNGFSLVRRILDAIGADYNEPAPFEPTQSLGEALLKPTRIYVQACLEAIGTGAVRGLAHITGGGLVENIPRILPDDLAVVLDSASWRAPAVFGWLAKAGAIAAPEMVRTFNCGVGMVIIVDPARKKDVCRALSAAGEAPMVIGGVAARGADGRQMLLEQPERSWAG